MRATRILVAATTLLTTIAFVGCSASVKQPGIESSTDAVHHLFAAAIDDDAEAARLVVPADLSSASLRESMAAIKSQANRQGGLAKASITDNPSEQMGAEHFVEVRFSGSDEVTVFSVIEDAEGIRVTPDPLAREIRTTAIPVPIPEPD